MRSRGFAIAILLQVAGSSCISKEFRISKDRTKPKGAESKDISCGINQIYVAFRYETPEIL